MKLVQLSSDDLEEMLSLRYRSLEHDPTAFMTTIEEEKERGPDLYRKTLSASAKESIVFGARNEDHLVGITGVYKGDRPKTRHNAYLWGMFVDIEHRRKGIGGFLLDEAIKHAKKEMDVVAINLSVEANHLEAKRLYHSRGFQTWGLEPKAIGTDAHYCDLEHMALNLKRT